MKNFDTNHPHMKNKENTSAILFLFSGTGNSLNVANRIQESIKNCKMLSIPKIIAEKKYNYEAEIIGLIFPVHFQNAPNIVRKLLRNIKITGNPYLFAVATSGGEIGRTFQNINEILEAQNRALHSEFSLVFPSNSIIMENRSSTPEKIEKLIKKSEIRINEVIETIRNNKTEKHIYKKSSFRDRFGCLMGRFFLYGIFNDHRFKVDNEMCARCGTCVSVCPLNNIEITNNKVTYNHNCECCSACLHWCPRNAIQHFRTRGVPRYHHPDIKVKHMRAYKSLS